MAEAVLDLIRQDQALARKRIKDGLAQARAKGQRLGRAKIDRSVEVAIRRALRKGDRGIHKIAAEFSVGTGTVQRIKNEMESG
jgi:DNA invertase Pin-like site-specific DNA recombinase